MLVKLKDIVNIQDDLYLAYEFCNGGNLRRYLKYFKKGEKLTKNYIILVIRCILTNYHSFKRITNICIKGFIV